MVCLVVVVRVDEYLYHKARDWGSHLKSDIHDRNSNWAPELLNVGAITALASVLKSKSHGILTWGKEDNKVKININLLTLICSLLKTIIWETQLLLFEVSLNLNSALNFFRGTLLLTFLRLHWILAHFLGLCPILPTAAFNCLLIQNALTWMFTF